MAYSTRSQVELRFGVENVRQWADVDNDGDATKIENRITSAIATADQEIDDTLRDGIYVVPIESSDGSASAPLAIQEVSWLLAGCDLYMSRGVQESDVQDTQGTAGRYTRIEKKARHSLERIRVGSRRIAARKNVVTMAPEVVED